MTKYDVEENALTFRNFVVCKTYMRILQLAAYNRNLNDTKNCQPNLQLFFHSQIPILMKKKPQLPWLNAL